MNPSTATTSAQAQQNLQNYAGTIQTPTQELQTADQNLGVGQAQQTVQGLQGAINNTTNLLNQVVPTVQGNTQNSLVTSSQAGQQEQNAEAPIQANLSQDEQSYNTANSNYTNLEGQAEDQANADETAQSNQLSYLQGIYNDLYTQEQNTQAQQEAQQQAAQQQSQFEQQLAASEGSGDATSQILSELLGNQGAAAAPTPAAPGGVDTQPSLGTIFGNAPKATASKPSTASKVISDAEKVYSVVNPLSNPIGLAESGIKALKGLF